MEREEAAAIFDQGRQAVVLLRMDEQIQRLEKRAAQQNERIAKLERRLGHSSRNSSQPPSADRPSAGPKRGKDPSGRAQGAQPGHEGHGRGLLPASVVDEVIDHWPAECGCGHRFWEAERVAAAEPVCHQVEELAVMAVGVTEHRAQRVRCPDCAKQRTAELPRRGRPQRVRPAVAGGGGDVVGAQPRLASRRGRAVRAAVLSQDEHRQRGGHLAARRRRA